MSYSREQRLEVERDQAREQAHDFQMRLVKMSTDNTNIIARLIVEISYKLFSEKPILSRLSKNAIERRLLMIYDEMVKEMREDEAKRKEAMNSI